MRNRKGQLPRMAVALGLAACLVCSGTAEADEPKAVSNHAGTILFLGDSITAAGGYVRSIEAELAKQAPPWKVIRRGKGSETISDLSEEDHPGRRPCLFARLDKELAEAKPDWVVACYGINDGIYHPYNEKRFAAYQAGIETLINKVQASGARVVLLTAPPYARSGPEFPDGTSATEATKLIAKANADADVVAEKDPRKFGYKSPYPYYDHVMARYAEWLLTLNDRNDVHVIDLRTPMLPKLKETHGKDAIHPNKFGHELMAKAFLTQWPAINAHVYSDGRPSAHLRMDAKDQGVILKHGDGPGQCDIYGAREALIFKENDIYHLFYDGAGPPGWRACLATSKDLKTWEKKGPILELGAAGEDDSAAACAPWVHFDGKEWHMFYLGTPKASRPPDRVPSFPYLTLKAKSKSLAGPWIKQPDVIPFRTQPGTYYSMTASPGDVVRHGDEYLQFFSATTKKPGNPSVQRTLGIARTKDLNGAWTIDEKPMVPIEEQIENSSIYYEKSNKTWFLFTNHIGIEGGEYTDAIWVYWTKDLNHWNPADKAVVLDGKNCTWSKKCIGMPSVIAVGNRLAVFYDAPGGDSKSHMKRDLGLAWLDLPLTPPQN